MKTSIVAIMMVLSLLVFLPDLSARIHHVTTPEEFQAALTTAQGNRETDFILVAPGEYVLSSTLIYDPEAGEEYPLYIGGYTLNKPVIRGSANFRGLLMHIRNLPCDAERETQRAEVLVSDLNFTDVFNPNGTAGLFIDRKDEEVTVANCKFTDLIAGSDGAIGGLGIITRLGRVCMYGNIFKDNVGLEVGGAAVKTFGSLIVHNNTFYSNTGAHYGGLAIHWESPFCDCGDTQSYVFNNIMWANDGDSSEPRSDFYYYMRVRATDHPDTLIANNVLNFGEGHVEFDDDPFVHSNPFEVVDEIHRDPILSEPELVPQATSPCIDAGTNPLPASYPFPPYDSRWVRRLLDGNLDGTAEYDIGAREFAVDLEERRLDFKFIPFIPKFKLSNDDPLRLLPLQQFSRSSDQRVGWNISLHRPMGSSRYTIHYGDSSEKNYKTGGKPNSGSLSIPGVDLAKFKKPVFRFSLFMDTEAGNKKDVLSIRADKKILWTKDAKNVNMKKWQDIRIDMAQFAGQKIDLSIQFATNDGLNNNGSGVYLDRINIEEKSEIKAAHKPYQFKPKKPVQYHPTTTKDPGKKQNVIRF